MVYAPLLITSLYFLFSEYVFNVALRFKTHVVFPTTELESEEHTPEFMAAQCRGAIGSTDAIHIVCKAGSFSILYLLSTISFTTSF